MKSVCVLWALLMLFVVSQAWAGTTYTMGYPPAGGVTLTQSGNPISNGGGTFAFSGFNTMDYVSLYWGVNTVANVAQSNVASPGNMTFYSYNPSTGIIAFVSTAPWTFTNTLNNTTVSMQTQLVVQLQPFGSPAGFLGSGALVGDTTTKGALGVSGEATDPLYQITSGGAYQATFEFETWDGSSAGIANGTDVLDFYTNNDGGNPTTVFNTSVDFEFWWSTQKTTSKSVQVGACKTNLQNYSSIQSAVNAVPSGAIIQVCPGTYPEQVTISAPVTLEGVSTQPDQVVLVTLPLSGLTQNGTGPVSGYPIYPQLLVQDAGPVNISGLTVDGSGSTCPSGASAGIVYLSTAAASSGKVSTSVIRNIAGGCSSPAIAVYGENGSGSASTLTVEGNSIHSFSGQGIGFGPNQGGTITGNTISQVNEGLSFQSAGPSVKATSNNINSTQNAVTLSSANGVVVQTNSLVNTSNTAISLNDLSGGGNTITRNTINEANCGVSKSNAGSDVFLPNTIVNVAATTCP